MKPILLFLTCADNTEADIISDSLLQKKLIACAKKSTVTSKFNWDGKKDEGTEVLLIMDSVEELFEQIEVEISQLHSYDTFVLIATPVIRTSSGIKEWFKKELRAC